MRSYTIKDVQVVVRRQLSEAGNSVRVTYEEKSLEIFRALRRVNYQVPQDRGEMFTKVDPSRNHVKSVIHSENNVKRIIVCQSCSFYGVITGYRKTDRRFPRHMTSQKVPCTNQVVYNRVTGGYI